MLAFFLNRMQLCGKLNMLVSHCLLHSCRIQWKRWVVISWMLMIPDWVLSRVPSTFPSLVAWIKLWVWVAFFSLPITHPILCLRVYFGPNLSWNLVLYSILLDLRLKAASILATINEVSLWNGGDLTSWWRVFSLDGKSFLTLWDLPWDKLMNFRRESFFKHFLLLLLNDLLY